MAHYRADIALGPDKIRSWLERHLHASVRATGTVGHY